MACQRRGNKMVCGMLHGGGTAKKSGLYRLAKGERVFSPQQLKKMAVKGAKSYVKKKGKKKCSCGCKHR